MGSKVCVNCFNSDIHCVYHRADVITYQNVLLTTIDEARSIPRGRLELYFCSNCTLLFNGAFDDSLVGYGEHYENSQNQSGVFQQHIADMTRRILHDNRITDHKILEIGCGNGYFLKELILETNANLGYGYDKSLGKNKVFDRLKLFAEYYTSEDVRDFDLVISRHVVEHLLENHSLLKLLKKNNPRSLYFYETPSLEWIINNNAFYDFFYEHCSYFSQYSLSQLFSLNDIKIEKIDFVFGGQYLWLESSSASNNKFFEKKLQIDNIVDFFSAFNNFILSQKEKLSQYSKKKVAVWGAGAKGVTFVNLLDPDCESISYVIDINPRKIGKFLPGTGHEIIGPKSLSEYGIEVIFVMNANYLNEIQNILGNRQVIFEMI